MTYLIALFLVFILAALGTAVIFMLRRSEEDNAPRSKRMVKALTWRIGLSVTLFLIVLVSWKMGWIQPTGIPLSK